MEPLDFSSRQIDCDIMDCMPHFLETQTPRTSSHSLDCGPINNQSQAAAQPSPHSFIQSHSIVYPSMFSNTLPSIRPPAVRTPITTNPLPANTDSQSPKPSPASSDDGSVKLSAQQLRLQRETPEERERRLTAGRERMRLYRQRERETETPEEKERRLAIARERARLCRSLETPEQRERRLKKSRERLRMKRQQESSSEREQRLKSHRDSKRER